MNVAIHRAVEGSSFDNRDWGAEDELAEEELRPSVQGAADVLSSVEVPYSVAQTALEIVALTNMERIRGGEAARVGSDALCYQRNTQVDQELVSTM